MSNFGATPPQRTPPGWGLLVVGLGLLGFSAYLVWYGARHMDTEPLMVAIVPLPLSLAALGWFFGRRFHKLAGLGVVVALALAFGAFGFIGWQSSADRRGGYHQEWEGRRIALPLCSDGIPLTNAPTYDLASGEQTIHIIGSVYGDASREIEWIPWREEEYPPSWFSEGLPNLVACMRGSYRVVESKSYQGSRGYMAIVEARQHSYDIELYEARTRTLVFQTHLEGGVPAPLPDSIEVREGSSTGNRDGSRVGPAEIAAALTRFVGPR